MCNPTMVSRSVLGSQTSSKSVTETMSGSHEFVIKGYSLTKGMGIGKYIVSETFIVGGFQWAIYFFPDGRDPKDNAAYVSVFYYGHLSLYMALVCSIMIKKKATEPELV